MYSALLALALAILFMDTAVLVRAGIFIVEPLLGSTCQAGKPCTVTWLDDGVRPLLPAIGVSTVGLYTGKQQLVQRLPPVDVGAAQSLTFIPNAAAGPNSDKYFIAITSTSLKNGTSLYTGWSPSFKLVDMSGSFDTPLPAATSAIPIPASLTTTRDSTTVLSTITVGASSTQKPSPSGHSSSVTKSASSASAPPSSPSSPSSSTPTASASRLLTSVLPPGSTPSSGSVTSNLSSPSALPASAPTAAASGSAVRASHLPLPIVALVIFSVSLLCFS